MSRLQVKADSAIPNVAPTSATGVSALGDGLDGGFVTLLTRTLSWAAAARALTAVGNLLRYALFARMLTPYDFGVTTTAFLTLDMLSALTSASFEKTLIQQREEIEPFLDTVWAFTVVRGALLALVLVIAARPIAAFFRQQEAAIVFSAVAPLALVRAVQSPGWVALFRRLELHVVLMLNAAELISSLTIGILAVLWWGDWRGLVAATIAGQAGRTLLSYWYFPYRPRMRFDLLQLKQMLRYGRWVTGTGIAEFASQQIDNFVVAHVLGPRAVGDYQMAFRIGEMPASELAYSASMVTFPIVSKLRARKDTCRRLLFYTSVTVIIVGTVYSGAILNWGTAGLRILFGIKWMGAMPALRILCFYGLFQGLLILGKSFLDGLGAPAASFNMTMVRAMVLVLLIYPLTNWYGLSGAAAAALGSVIMPLPVMLMLYSRVERKNTLNQQSVRSANQ